ncbi:terpene synthase family protein [Streptomyces sp. NPDC005805]|uniref:terpene synthase family protein n=1 Tax=Streptomyces sp. NPDC005805 TaxID=3157068 RepID=UPI0033D894D6
MTPALTEAAPSSYVVPPLAGRLPVARHPDALRAEQMSARWLSARAGSLAGSPDAFAAYQRQRNGLFGAFAHPQARADRLQALVDWWNLAAFIDDLSSRAPGAGHAEAGPIRLLSTLHEVWQGRTAAPDAPLAAAVADVWQRLTEDMPARQKARAGEGLKELVTGFAREVPWRRGREFPSLEKYFGLRWQSFGSDLLFTLTEFGLGLDLSDTVHGPLKEDLDALHCLAMRQAALVNDVLSLRKELEEEGFAFNSVELLRSRAGMSLQDAVNAVCALVRKYEAAYLAKRAEVARVVRGERPLLTYLDGVDHLLGGCLHFQCQTSRYHGGDAPWNPYRSRLVKVAGWPTSAPERARPNG